MAATRYALMMRRFAKTHEEANARVQRNRAMPMVAYGVLDAEVGY